MGVRTIETGQFGFATDLEGLAGPSSYPSGLKLAINRGASGPHRCESADDIVLEYTLVSGASTTLLLRLDGSLAEIKEGEFFVDFERITDQAFADMKSAMSRLATASDKITEIFAENLGRFIQWYDVPCGVTQQGIPKFRRQYLPTRLCSKCGGSHPTWGADNTPPPYYHAHVDSEGATTWIPDREPFAPCAALSQEPGVEIAAYGSTHLLPQAKVTQ